MENPFNVQPRNPRSPIRPANVPSSVILPQSRQRLLGQAPGRPLASDPSVPFPVSVVITSTDLPSHKFSGFLTAQGLSNDYPLLCTYFEAEIVGSRKCPFLTNKWGADEYIDASHWGTFPAFQKFASQFTSESFAIDPFADNATHIFMRWKEMFLVPDHKVASIAGASISGFYYVALERATGILHGYYFHESSDPFQHLHLEFVPSRSVGTYQFL
eukprot:ANDGO_06920.mRNA.1 Vacuolar import and degradation protein 24